MWKYQLRSILFFIFYYFSYVNGGAIQLTSSNIDSVLSSNEVVFINFYANWCRFSQMLDPIYNELADKVAKEFPQQGLIAIGKVDCDSDNAIAIKYHVNKYPTLKLYRHGIMTKKEYRGARQVDSFIDFLRKHVESSIIKLSAPSGLVTLDANKRYIVGHFDDENAENYKTFSKVASLLRDECHFVASTNKDEFTSERPTNDVIYYRPPSSLNEKETYYMGTLNEQESLATWSREKCIPLVREITFANAEELTDEGLPFLILFHKADDHESVVMFEREVAKQLQDERSSINCLHADGAQFMHPLQHLGKSAADLPLLAIDSFKHMFLFPDIKEISHDGKLLQFVKDLHSEKLHRDFHNPPPPTQPTTTTIAAAHDGGDSKSKHIPKTSSTGNADASSNSANQFLKSGSQPSSPPESVFVRLSPNRARYSFRDEL
jgi:endoplasmic reticulum resident protein 44